MTLRMPVREALALLATGFAAGAAASALLLLLKWRAAAEAKAKKNHTENEGGGDASETSTAEGEEGTAGATKAALLAERRALTCAALSVSYANTEPLCVVRGRQQHLYDVDGTRYLDTRNNVAHVGHCHPAVVRAVQAQVAAVNTNSRYLHPNLTALAKQLLATFPPELGQDAVVFFVNSGSEANDLALRLAQAWRPASSEILVFDHAYHGHTARAIEASPYKFEHPRYLAAGWPRPAHTHAVPAPNVYRNPAAGQLSAEAVEQLCARLPAGSVQAMLVESGMSVAGVLIPPDGVLQRCFAAVRQAGGLCICDEVQTGLGRVGSSWWCFQLSGVVPDIVTVGKPFGNGMPLGAVVCRRAVACAFAEGPEYFNTFGGNPVCLAAGLAVLRVLREERLPEHALHLGTYLMEALRQLAREPAGALIGDVRGHGLFLGVEFVRCRTTKAPADREVAWLCSRLKDVHRILTSVDGPGDNVMVLKPPLCFSVEDARRFVAALADCLVCCSKMDRETMTHTPT